MAFQYFSYNGEVKTASEAVVPLDNVEYAYGFGVYETIRLAGGKLYFIEDHCQRLMNSAQIIELEHDFNPNQVKQYVEELVKSNRVDTCNVKIMLVGGASKDEAKLYILCLNPLFVERSLYRDGVKCISENYERLYPRAKTLNMLPSYLAYRKAHVVGAYDALFIDRAGCIREGSRTNVLAFKGRSLISPPEADILPGIMREQVLQVAKKNGFKVEEQTLPLASLNEYDALVLTSASSKILPIGQIDDTKISTGSEDLRELMQLFNDYLKAL